MKPTPINRTLDAYEISFGKGPKEEQRLFEEVDHMEKNSKWIADLDSKNFRLSAVDGPIFAEEVALAHKLDLELTQDTADYGGTRLIIHLVFNGQTIWSKCVRSTARGTLCETAKLNGSALSRMSAENLAATLNNGLEVARGTSLVLERYGKISALHSDAAGGYKVMPISSLLQIIKEEVGARFGKMDFISGHNQHSYTSAVWLLPKAKDDLLTAYQEALKDAVSHTQSIDFMPAIRFYASDTAASAARVIPLFISRKGAEIRLVDGVQVKHERRLKKTDPNTLLGTTAPAHPSKEELDGIELFQEEVKDLYAMFTDSVAKVQELGRIEVWHPENCVVSLCKKFNIPKKYGEVAREEAEILALSSPCLSAHDVYLAMNCVVIGAKNAGATATTLNFLSEAVAKVLNVTDWAEHDVGGVVAW